jgi:hypothetical protein
MTEKEPNRDVIIFYDKDRHQLFPKRPSQVLDGEANYVKIVIRTYPPDAPVEFVDETIWIGSGFQEGISEHDGSKDPLRCNCENCTRHHHHLETRKEMTRKRYGYK